MKAIGLDIGTTGICGILMDGVSGEVIKTASRSNDTAIPGEKDFERLQSPEKIWEKVSSILDELSTNDISVIGVTGQMHGIVYTDKNGMAVSPLFTWQDKRGEEEYNGTTYAEAISSHSGYGNVTNFYNRKNGLIPKEATHFCTIHDYVVMRLTGRKEPLVHISDGASFGCYDLEKREFTMVDELLPEVTDKTEIAGEWNGIPVSVAIGDNQASFIGCGCSEGDVLINIGTGSQVSFVTNDDTTPLGMELRPLTGNTNIMVGSSLCGGRAYAALERFFGSIIEAVGQKTCTTYWAMEKLGEKSKNTDMKFSTLFCGTRDEPEKRAEITNISLDNFTPGDMTAACLYGMANELFDLYRTSGRATRAVASGNGVRKNKLLREILENVFGMKLCVPGHCEEAAYGAALFAEVAAGICKDIKEAEEVIRYDI